MPFLVGAKTRFHQGKLHAKLRCPGCHHSQWYPASFAEGLTLGADHAFGFPLFLGINIGSDRLWAFNMQHVELLEDYLRGRLRERAITSYKMTMLARLPSWMKRASRRERVLDGLARLRAMALEAGVA
jgi:hypothetical protein